MSRSTAAKRREYLVNYRAVTSRQAFALSNVVTDPDDTERPKAFAKTIVNDGRTFGTILTVDRLDEHLTWHVSVTSLSDQFKPILWEELKPSEREAVRQLARELLEDVGRPASDLEDVQEKMYRKRATRSSDN